MLDTVMTSVTDTETQYSSHCCTVVTVVSVDITVTVTDTDDTQQ